jgi:uncharacterized protein YjlB
VTFNNGDGEQRRGSAAPHVLQLTAVGWSHPTWPALIYYSAVPLQVSDPAASVEAMFDRNAWPAHWRNGVYSFHHYHSNAHEVLGFAAGEAHLMLGGPNGSEVTVRAGDVVVLPAGTGHFRIDASRNLLVVGGYPPGEKADLCRVAATTNVLAQIAQLPCPATDPVHGTAGPLTLLWPVSGP